MSKPNVYVFSDKTQTLLNTLHKEDYESPADVDRWLYGNGYEHDDFSGWTVTDTGACVSVGYGHSESEALIDAFC